MVQNNVAGNSKSALQNENIFCRVEPSILCIDFIVSKSQNIKTLNTLFIRNLLSLKFTLTNVTLLTYTHITYKNKASHVITFKNSFIFFAHLKPYEINCHISLYYLDKLYDHGIFRNNVR